MRDRFWETVPLVDMTGEEWEALCDGCGRCCLVKLEDEDTGELHYTDVACRYLDCERCRCTSYDKRSINVPDCLRVTPAFLAERARWLPETCAYRQLYEGTALEQWHPLVSGTTQTVIDAGISMRGELVSEVLVHPDDYEHHLINWVR
ncbi:MAG: YcgN family cysteine cluster protein [Alcanivoracaceae bacterium]